MNGWSKTPFTRLPVWTETGCFRSTVYPFRSPFRLPVLPVYPFCYFLYAICWAGSLARSKNPWSTCSRPTIIVKLIATRQRNHAFQLCALPRSRSSIYLRGMLSLGWTFRAGKWLASTAREKRLDWARQNGQTGKRTNGNGTGKWTNGNGNGQTPFTRSSVYWNGTGKQVNVFGNVFLTSTVCVVYNTVMGNSNHVFLRSDWTPPYFILSCACVMVAFVLFCKLYVNFVQLS